MGKGMPFGMYKGRPLVEIPDEYLWWLIDSVEMRRPLDRAVRDELRRRHLASVLSEWFTKVGAKHDVDKGGHPIAWLALVDARDELFRMLEREGFRR